MGEGSVGGEGNEEGGGSDVLGICGELLGLPGKVLGIPRWEDGRGTWQPANTDPNTNARPPIANCRIDGFDDERKWRLIAIS
ncbi:MAG: hypothetical protein OXQ90_15170 [Gammaproteobacteria bacterium]|nr:hypothetical protein [Gammaproteobacteria bacterium]